MNPRCFFRSIKPTLMRFFITGEFMAVPGHDFIQQQRTPSQADRFVIFRCANCSLQKKVWLSPGGAVVSAGDRP